MLNLKSKFKNIKVIGFDLDQTLYPKSPQIDEAIQGYIYKKIADFKQCSISDAEKLFKDLYKNGSGLSGSQTLKTLQIPNSSEIVQEALENADIEKFLQPDKKVIQILRELKNKFSLDLITGSWKNVSDSKLKKLEIPLDIFTNIITGDIAGKTDGVAYKLWLSLYSQYKPSEFLYIGDRIMSDFIVPNQMDINSILVNIKDIDKNINCLQLNYFYEIEKILM